MIETPHSAQAERPDHVAERTVVCVVDGSAAAARGIELAAEMAAALALELVVVDLGHDDTAVDSGPAATAGLAGLARDQDAALIVVAAQRRSGVGAELRDTAVSALPSAAPCPVIVLPEQPVAPPDEAFVTPATVVCGVDDSGASQAAAAAAGRMASSLHARIALVHVRAPLSPRPDDLAGRLGARARRLREPRSGSARVLRRAIRWTGCAEDRVELVLDAGEPSERLRALADARAPALLVVGHGAPHRGALGSTSRTLAAAAGHPVMIVSDQVPARAA